MPVGLDQSYSDRVFYGSIIFVGPVAFSAPIIGDANVIGASNIAASKLEHQHEKHSVLCNHTTSAAVVRQGMHEVYGASATILSFKAWVTVAATSTGVITIDLLKNGTSILTAAITIDSTVATFTDVAASLASTGLVVGDKLEVAILTATSTVLPKGVNVDLVLREKAQ